MLLRRIYAIGFIGMHQVESMDAALARLSVAIPILAFCLLIPNQTAAREYQVVHYTSRDGLANNKVIDIDQDSNGFMWFLTGRGLCRFDGRSFKTFWAPDIEPHTSAAEFLRTLLCDDIGGIWIGTEFGAILSFNRHDNTFDLHRLQACDSAGIDPGPVISLFMTTGGGLIAVSQNGSVHSWNQTRNQFELLYCTTFSKVAKAVYDPARNGLWIQSNNQLHFVGYSTAKHRRWRVVDSRQRESVSVLQMFISDGTLAFGAKGDNTIYEAEAIDSSVAELQVSLWGPIGRNPVLFPSEILSAAADSVYWLATSNAGLFQWHRTLGITHHFHSGAGENALLDNNITTLFRDDGDNLWIATDFGVTLLAAYNPGFHRFRMQELRTMRCRAILVDKNASLWVGTDAGVVMLRHPPGKAPDLQRVPLPRKFAVGAANALLEDRNGTIWMGFTTAGLLRYRPETGFSSPIGSFRESVYSFLESSDGTLWVGTRAGLDHYNTVADTVIHFYSTPSPSPTEKRFVFDIVRYRNRIWAATVRGLMVIDPARQRIERVYRFDAKDSASIIGNDVWSLCQDSRGYLWVAVYGKGVCRYDPAGDTFTRYGELDGLTNNNVYGILMDNNGSMWISSDKGIFNFVAGRERFRNFQDRDGLHGNEFFFGAYYKDSRNGMLYFGGVGGISRVDPDAVADQNNRPRLAITSVQVFDSTVSTEMFNGDTLALRHDQNFIRVEFATLDFAETGLQQYMYRLEGFDNQWVHNGADNRAVYTRLPAGEYTFRVRAAGRNGEWTPDSFAITLLMEPAWWERTWGFRIPVFLLLAGFAAWYIQLNVRRVSLRRKLLASELHSLRLQMNPHFLSNSLAAIQRFILARQTTEANEYLSNFARLVRSILERSGRELVPLDEELDFLRRYLDMEQLRFVDAFEWSIDIDPSIDSRTQLIPTMLLQPLAENAIIHGFQQRKHKGFLHISFQRNGGRVLCLIADNGVGYRQASRSNHAAAQYKTSRGIAITRERLRLLGRRAGQKLELRIRDRSEEPGNDQGTLVEIDLPG